VILLEGIDEFHRTAFSDIIGTIAMFKVLRTVYTIEHALICHFSPSGVGYMSPDALYWLIQRILTI